MIEVRVANLRVSSPRIASSQNRRARRIRRRSLLGTSIVDSCARVGSCSDRSTSVQRRSLRACRILGRALMEHVEDPNNRDPNGWPALQQTPRSIRAHVTASFTPVPFSAKSPTLAEELKPTPQVTRDRGHRVVLGDRGRDRVEGLGGIDSYQSSALADRGVSANRAIDSCPRGHYLRQGLVGRRPPSLRDRIVIGAG